MSKRQVDEFDIYAQIFHSGNRQDMEDGEEFASWVAWRPNPSATHVYLMVYDDDNDEYRDFIVRWEERPDELSI